MEARIEKTLTCGLISTCDRAPRFLEASAYLKEHYLPQGWFSVATFQEPGWRIEGKKSLGLELAEPAAGHGEIPAIVAALFGLAAPAFRAGIDPNSVKA